MKIAVVAVLGVCVLAFVGISLVDVQVPQATVTQELPAKPLLDKVSVQH